MEESIFRQKKRKREEEEDLPTVPQQTDDPKIKSPERKKKKAEKRQQPRKQKYRNRRRRPKQPKVNNKPVSTENYESLYTVGERLGEGGFGVVFGGTRISDGLQVAIKFIPKQEDDRYFKSPHDSRSIPIEVALMQKMSEPPVKNIIQLIEWFDEPERYILILERFYPCMDLNGFIQTYGGSVSEQMARHLMIQVVEAVIECQKRGVFHRDIKVDNILINTDTLKLKLIDFGCGDLIRRYGYSYFEGTLEYCPPEFFLKGRYCAIPATVWSLGVMLFQVVSASFPFKDEDEILGGQLNFKDGLSDEFHELVRLCLQAQPSSRPNLQQILDHKWFKSSFPAQERFCQFL
ncbi:serine/threonine-protein kinase pim-2 isoform X6 [Astyanax mexicanus]|uniref:non-specific serine/threonine protein kinase n=1 Tax=Astyanax mexicanus TaxID=7994 RepID=A0A3B1JE74_ASTMX|nr:serine/threonine-protein kinase pim-2 isoform X1 [Astyanax mexicanus]XP_049323857.1 serine/threonine-protein kinase pim-2 isoform X2 [Astyanax mexicanus]XP_049323858.1 serine/threonine-protein kinase pim-2 isoform X3 [Astyanax mexicanus]XP_049323859.1 serine/threonine-protein kinase pim-2 isoform X4 [Astyanax mexicanus]XP_049323860.1 serine/threonine-protein kinase pim-2 isoform X5 [Astyanax mexicanus]XP_049323861.1 serine/threonine-protein kinase pim-2 isoform X6 [Astyanax mexicanus]